MEGQQKQQKGQGALNMTEINDALPSVTSNTPSSPSASYPSNYPQYQYSSSPSSAYQSGQYQQPYSGGQSPAYVPGPSESSYYSFTLGQQPSDPSQLQLQYVGYRNTPAASPVSLPQYPPGVQRPMQQGQSQAYNIPRYQYQQQYPQVSVPSPMSISAYATSPPSRSPQQFLQQNTNPVYPPLYLSTTVSHPFSADEGSVSSDPEQLLPRGPPRKPKQSGFALWVGNLPRDVLLEELKEFFSLDGLESIFLIRKSNCAFVNYKTEESCSLALSTFNDKIFKNVRLVCRLRKSSPARAPTLSTTASSSAISSSQTLVSDVAPPASVTPLPEKTMEGGESQSADDSPLSSSTPAQTPKNRYFIMKSLTKEDLAWSVNNKVWATQPHNEGVLNDAFKNSENVYLIFSVNKSGEFFGYAKMASEINDLSSPETLKKPPMDAEVHVLTPPVLLAGPKTTVTPRTSTAPRGKIFEDEVRGTVFWEVAESSEDEDVAEEGEQVKADERWGNPFRVEWIKWENPLLFQRTRLLRNPWNGNREVKISRDGTEIEPSVGARLLKEFDSADPASFPQGTNTQIVQGQRRMSYPTMAPFRSIPPSQLLYQQPVSQMQPQGVAYVPYTALQGSQPVVYSYGQNRGTSQQPYGGPGQQYYPPQQ